MCIFLMTLAVHFKVKIIWYVYIILHTIYINILYNTLSYFSNTVLLMSQDAILFIHNTHIHTSTHNLNCKTVNYHVIQRHKHMIHKICVNIKSVGIVRTRFKFLVTLEDWKWKKRGDGEGEKEGEGERDREKKWGARRDLCCKFLHECNILDIY